MKQILAVGLLLAALFGCGNALSAPIAVATPNAAATPSPVAQGLPPAAPTQAQNSIPTEPVATPSAGTVPAATAPRSTSAPDAGPTATVFPTPFAGTLTLKQRETFALDCDTVDPFTLQSSGLDEVAYIPTGDCQNGEIALFEIGEKVYIAQSGLFGAAFTLTEVTNPAAPQIIGVWDLPPFSATLDLKPFRQGERSYIALGLQRGREDPSLPCGIVIIEVTNVRQPELVTRLHGRNVGAPEPWCNVHTLEIDTDAQGNATFIVVSDVDTYSARTVDIRDLENPRETNFYHLHAHPHAVPEQPVLNYVHDSYVAADKVYLAYWLSGVVILDKQKFEAGLPQEPLIIKPTDDVSTGGFRVHYVVPVGDGEFLFVQDELNADNGIRLLDIRDPENPKTVWVDKNVGGVNAPHNFVVQDDLLFVGWYNDGFRVYRFDISDPDNSTVEKIASQEVRANKNITRERYFDGIWGVRVHECTVQNEPRTCIYASDMSSGLIITALSPS